MSQEKNSDFKLDINPKSWLSKYRQTSTSYLIKMSIFYYGIAWIPVFLVLIFEVNSIGNIESHVPISFADISVAIPFEETAFFGIPFYLTGNPFVMLGTGIAWSLLHLFNSGDTIFSPSNLTYANSAYVFVTLFFHLRTWRSGKGWFSVLVHYTFDLVYISLTSDIGIFSSGEDLYTVLSFIILDIPSVSIFYLVYKWRKKRDARKYS